MLFVWVIGPSKKTKDITNFWKIIINSSLIGKKENKIKFSK